MKSNLDLAHTPGESLPCTEDILRLTCAAMAPNDINRRFIVRYRCLHPLCRNKRRGLGASDQTFVSFETLSKHYRGTHEVKLTPKGSLAQHTARKLEHLAIYEQVELEESLHTITFIRAATAEDPGAEELLTEVSTMSP